MSDLLPMMPINLMTGPNLSLKGKVDPDKAWKVSQEFELTFVSHMLQEVFTGNEDGLFGGGKTEVLFRSLFIQEVAKSMEGQFGIAESVYPILMKNAE